MRRAAAIVGIGESAPPLLPLTSLRFFAAAAIVAHHMQGRWVERGAWRPFLLDQAVSFFFVLSGFILTYVHPELSDRRARLRFLQARIARIWPAHVAALGLLMLLLEQHGGYGTGVVSAGVALLNVALLHAWVPILGVYASYNNVSWSISTELGFYLFFPWLIQRLNTTWWWKLAGTALLAVALARLSTALDLSSDSLSGVVYVNPLARLFEFTLGMCTALLFRRIRPRLALGVGVATALEAAAIAAMLENMRASAQVIDALRANGWIDRGLASWLGHGGLCCLSFALVVLVFAIGRGWLSRLLSRRILVLLGDISFTMYLLHQILLHGYDQRRELLEAVPLGLSVAIYLVVLLFLSYWTWAAIERPLRARIASLGRPGPRARSGGRGGALFAPGRRALAVESVLAVTLLASLFAIVHHPVSIDPAPSGFASGEPGVVTSLRDVRFGIAATLRAIRLQRDGASLDVALAWRMVRGVPDDTRVALQVLDESGRILARADYHTTARRAGETAIDRVRIGELAPTATRLGIVLQPRGETVSLFVDRGARDQQDRRLLIDLPPH